MPYKEPKIEKLFYSMGEVADMFNINASTIRYWEKHFDHLKPRKNNKGNRQFTQKDLDDLKVIYHLLKERGLTIKGAKSKLKQNKNDVVENTEIVERLQKIKSMLNEVKENL
ncbi:MerR family transcriptional regulator [Salinivirga cyanobacteriivorans]|uniref:HTH-type transcriptional repressor YcgE n=1 Tax=Salinivirga cyanobacteriivorans TaxID=1307839 RepID=A0A0S2I2I5_9BACT|nr:MerR family transcriptional regulator [Salinivirga cyanobacteriivorans]ALO16643.1 HTH-type transcriptional repressor YcgE [Salinivirga cyanobacteriivorans]